MIKKTFISILILALVGLAIYKNKDYLFVQLNPVEFEDKYSQSQYILGDGSEAWISDSELYVYAGHAYWLGENPTTINFEHPPLGKYYYGAFFHILGNPYWGSVVLFLLILVLISQITKELLLNLWQRSLAILLTGSLSLMQVHTRYALLDLPQLAGTLFFFLSLFKLEEKITQSNQKSSAANLWSISLGLSLGIIMSVKYWFPTISLFVGLMVVEAIRIRSWMIYLKSLLIGGFVYLLSYLVYFFEGNSLLQFFQFELYRFNWFMGKADAPPFLIFQTLFTGKFETHWDKGNYEITQYWSYLWPISFVSSIIVILIDRLKNLRLSYLLGYSFLLLAIYSLGAAASDRFFIQLLPFWMIGVVFLTSKLINYYLSYDRKKKLNKLISIALPMVLILSYLLLSMDAFVYPGVIQNHLRFDARIFLVLTPAIVYLLNSYTNYKKNGFWSIHQSVAVTFMILAIGLVVTEFFTYSNFVFSTVSIHYSRFFYLSITMMFVTLANKPKSYFHKNWRLLIFLLPAILIPFAMIIFMRDPDIFRWMVSEDSLIEWVQFFLLMFCSFSSFSIARKFGSKNKFLALCFYLAALICFFVGGEEISWGQRLLEIQTPEQWAERNTQGETTLHNLDFVFGYVYVGYMIIGLLGSTLWIVRKVALPYLSSKISFIMKTLIPDCHLFWYFAVVFLYNYERVFMYTPRETLWEEPMELLLILGITFFFLQKYLQNNKKLSLINSINL